MAAAGPPPRACNDPDPAHPVVRQLPWAQDLLGAERVWPQTRGAGVTVAVIDSGVDADHPQLRRPGKVKAGRDWFLEGHLPGNYDCISHGTAVAGIIAADPASGIGFHGIAPDATILPVRVTDRETSDGESSHPIDPGVLARGIVYAVDQGAKVINLSLAGSRDQKPVRQAIAYAVSKDVVIVAAVGNRQSAQETARPSYPASYPGVLGVGGIDISGSRVSGSQEGTYVGLVAPGAGILAPTRQAGHMYVDGTSFSAPFVAASAALVRAAWPKMSAAEVIQRLKATATPARGGSGSLEYGAGIVDPYRAVTEGMAAVETAVPAAAHRPEDPRFLAQQAWWHNSSEQARRLTVLAMASAISMAVLGLIVTVGRRRRWSAVRTTTQPSTGPAADEPLPEHLFGKSD